MKDIYISGIVGIGIGIGVALMSTRFLFVKKDITILELQEGTKKLEEDNKALNLLNENSKKVQEELTVVVDIQTLKIKKVMTRLDTSMEKFREYFTELHDRFDIFINNLENTPMDAQVKSTLMTEAIQIHTEIDNFLPSPYEYVNSYYPYLVVLLLFVIITKILYLRNSKYLIIKNPKVKLFTHFKEKVIKIT